MTGTAANVVIYILTRNFNFFRVSQLTLFLFAPFVIQWTIGNFISASRITSEGIPDTIHCDAATHRRLADCFDFHPPRTLYLKGKGDMTVYQLIGRKVQA